jgi:hypothetical protein
LWCWGCMFRLGINIGVWCRLSIVVDDGNGTAQFQLYDYVLDGIPSLHFKTMVGFCSMIRMVYMLCVIFGCCCCFYSIMLSSLVDFY